MISSRLTPALFLAILLIQTSIAAGEPAAVAPVLRPTNESIHTSMAIGLQHLINSQTPAGNFTYAYDVKTQKAIEDDNEVRQAGALWGLALLHREIGNEISREAVERGIGFFLTNTRTADNGLSYVSYPGSSMGKTGTVALFSLALIDFLAAEPALANKYYPELERCIAFLLSLRKNNGQFLAFYDLETGKGLGEKTSPYFDGETLLALVRAAKERGMGHLRDLIMGSAETMYRENVENPLAQDPHSRITKGFYQWGSMAYYQIFTSGWEGGEKYSSRTVKMAAWMVFTEQVLKRTRNTAYAYEGLVSAWVIARDTRNEKALARLTETIDRGLSRLMTLQIGGPFPNVYSGTAVEKDAQAQGGVLDSPGGPVLRIDVTQHQMHALILAQRYIYTKKS